MLSVVCVKWGTLYGPEYVQILADAVRRHLAVEHRFVCFTDDPTGLDGIDTRPLPGDLEGWWNKLWLFSGVLKGRVLYFDLDTLIVRTINEIASYNGDLALLRDFYRPDGYGSGVMAFDAEKCRYIWDQWNAAGRPLKPGGDQEWIELAARKRDLWQDLHPGAFVSFKKDCLLGPPRDARVVCFHGKPRPHEKPDRWVAEVWKVGGLSAVEYEAFANLDSETMLAQIAENCERKIPWLGPSPETTDSMVLVGGGPSLPDQVKHIRARRRRDQDIWAINGTHDFLIERGVVPDFMVMMDARIENLRFVQKPHEDVIYMIASMCHPEVFEALKDQRVVLWHAHIDGAREVIEPGREHLPIGLIGGGGTMGLRALHLGHAMGYRRFHLYGYDSCYQSDKHHAYDQPMNDGQIVTDVVVDGRRFQAAWWMIRQTDEFQNFGSQLANLGCQITVHGDGLLPYVAKRMTANAKARAA